MGIDDTTCLRDQSVVSPDQKFKAGKNFFQSPGIQMPAVSELKKIIQIARTIIFPGFFEIQRPELNHTTAYIEERTTEFSSLLQKQVHNSLVFSDPESDPVLSYKRSENITNELISALPGIRKGLQLDVIATYEGDPAAPSVAEVIYSYPTVRAMISYRIAHHLLKSGVPLLPRIISELAHSETGIDIHPGARIGESFSIDHGTGVVIGETCIIGKNVRIFQSVTLGAKKFPLDENGKPVKGIPRHPIVEDNVVIYANATILGRIRIGRNSVIGGNVWITSDIPPGSRVLQQKAVESFFQEGAGI
jgi:serine O-acetyltransferase